MRPYNLIGEPFIELSEVDSTNNYAMRQAQAQMAEHGATWFAWYQNAGKGQRGKQWNAERGLNLMMSTIVEPYFLTIENQFLLNICVSLACYDLINSYSTVNTSIKWPNDIYISDRKAGGILIENIVQGKDWRFSIVGIGININQIFFPDQLTNAVSLKQITEKTYDVILLAKELCKNLENRWQQLGNGKPDELLEEYCQTLFKTGQKVNFRKDNILFEAEVTGVNKLGELLLQHEGKSIKINGNIEWILS